MKYCNKLRRPTPLCNIVINREDPRPPHNVLRNIWTAPNNDNIEDDQDKEDEDQCGR